jgi:hydroxymethylglutaryl-CoA lyase
MANIPKFVLINEEGPREGFQIEPGPIPTAQKIELIDALSDTGLKQIQIVSYVSPKRVPGMADADEVVAGFKRKAGVKYTALWLNDIGFERAFNSGKLDISGSISLTASAAFLKKNQQRTMAENLYLQALQVDKFLGKGIPVRRGSIMAAFGCNYQGDIPTSAVLEQVRDIFSIAVEKDVKIETLSLADTMGWGTPDKIKRLVGAIQDKYPDITLSLHLHDTRGMGIANAYAGLEMGVGIFDATVGGLGGCPFAGNKGAAGNLCTEDLAFLCAEMGIETGIDLDQLINTAILAEKIVGHPLGGSVKTGGALAKYRSTTR